MLSRIISLFFTGSFRNYPIALLQNNKEYMCRSQTQHFCRLCSITFQSLGKCTWYLPLHFLLTSYFYRFTRSSSSKPMTLYNMKILSTYGSWVRMCDVMISFSRWTYLACISSCFAWVICWPATVESWKCIYGIVLDSSCVLVGTCKVPPPLSYVASAVTSILLKSCLVSQLTPGLLERCRATRDGEYFT